MFEMNELGPAIVVALFHFLYHLQIFDESFGRIDEREQTSNLDRPKKTKVIEREKDRGVGWKTQKNRIKFQPNRLVCYDV